MKRRCILVSAVLLAVVQMSQVRACAPDFPFVAKPTATTATANTAAVIIVIVFLFIVFHHFSSSIHHHPYPYRAFAPVGAAQGTYFYITTPAYGHPFYNRRGIGVARH